MKRFEGWFVSQHPEFAAEQAYLTWAYECLETMRTAARVLQYSIETGPGGTHQARFERDVVEDRAMDRLSRLQIGGESLMFGRIDCLGDDGPNSGERFYIGRLPVSDREQNPVIVDWRAPMAESFYRATGADPLGLERRRHFATEADRLVGVDDEVFSLARLEHENGLDLVGTGALLSALGRARRGQMRDIVATIQREQDEIIRSELAGALVVQGGPGTGKTAVALHRTAYLLYSHRFPLDRQGVLVVGPSRLFIRYIGRVLPALGEHAVELASIDDLVADVAVRATDSHETARVKGDIRMAPIIRRAVLTRQRAPREPLKVQFGVTELTLSVEEMTEIVQTVKRAHRVHNAARKQLQTLLCDRLADRYREALARFDRADITFDRASIVGQLKRNDEVRASIDRMWPWLTPTVLLRDLYGASALIKAAARDQLTEAEQKALLRPRGVSMEDVRWTSADIALLDEAAIYLGALPANAHVPGSTVEPTAIPGQHRGVKANDPHEEGIRTYGHLVVDEAQDLSPMQLRMLGRRSLNGSMTIVGDIGQATGMWAPKSWEEVLAHLPIKRSRKVELTVGYRAPAEVMELAARVLAVAAPELSVPRSVRSQGELPVFVVTAPEEPLTVAVARALADLKARLGDGTVGVLCPTALVDPVSEELLRQGVALDPNGSMGDGIGVLAIGTAKGLEFDGVVVVEPAQMIREAAQGLRSLYVAVTRTTRLLTIVSSEPLPAVLTSAPVGGA